MIMSASDRELLLNELAATASACSGPHQPETEGEEDGGCRCSDSSSETGSREQERMERPVQSAYAVDSQSAESAHPSRYRLYGAIQHAYRRYFLTLRGWLYKYWICREVAALLNLSVPITINLSLQESLLFVSMLYVGHISGAALELDAAGLGMTFVNMTGISIGIGLSSATETLFSQTYGFKNYKRVGVVLQRGILILSLVLFPIFAIWLNSQSLLLLIHQSACVAKLSSLFVRIFTLALPSVVWTLILVGILSNSINAAAHGIMIYGLGLGIPGAAASLVFAYVSSPLMLVAYMKIRGVHKLTWGGWSWDSLREWGQFLKLSIPGLLMTGIEWWSFEISMLVAGSIDETQLAINSILISLLSVVYMLPLGVGVAATVRVGNELGSGNPQAAKRASYTAVGIIVVVGVISALVLGVSRNRLGRLFVNDDDVIDGVAKTMYVVCPLVFFDELQVTLAGILKGCGRQILGAAVTFVSYYVIGLPIGITLALVANLGAMGLWTGLAIATACESTTFLVVLMCTNWDYQSRKAMQNAQDNRQVAISSEVADCKNNITANEFEVYQQDHCQDSDNENCDDGNAVEATTGTQTLLLETVANRAATKGSITKSRLKLLLFRSIFFICGALLLIAGGVASTFHPPSNSTDCWNSNGTLSNISSIARTYTSTANLNDE